MHADAFQQAMYSRMLIGCQLTGLTVLLYDYMLCASRELSLVWTRKITPSILLYLITRYALVPMFLVEFALVSRTPHCTAWARFAKALELVAQLGVATLLTLRTYALYDRRRAVLFAVALLGLGIPTTGAWGIISVHCKPGTMPILYSSIPPAAILYSFAWLAFDTGVIALTLYRIKQLSHGRRFDKMGTLSLILHHGFIYYVVLSFMNITNIVVYFTTPIGVNGIGIYLGRAISVVSISHLLLDLRETFAAPVSSVSPIAFRGSAMTDSSLLASNEWRGRGWSRIPDSYSSRGSTQSQSMPEAETGILLQKMGMGRRSGDTDTMDESRNSEDTLI